MANFKLSGPPVLSGDYKNDSKNLDRWLNELYESLWVEKFIENQIKKNQKSEVTKVEDESS